MDFDEISLPGIVCGLVSAGFIFAVRKQMLIPFTQAMSPVQAVFWTVATYAACAVAGYFIGLKLLSE